MLHESIVHAFHHEYFIVWISQYPNSFTWWLTSVLLSLFLKLWKNLVKLLWELVTFINSQNETDAELIYPCFHPWGHVGHQKYLQEGRQREMCLDLTCFFSPRKKANVSRKLDIEKIRNLIKITHYSLYWRPYQSVKVEYSLVNDGKSI